MAAPRSFAPAASSLEARFLLTAIVSTSGTPTSTGVGSGPTTSPTQDLGNNAGSDALPVLLGYARAFNASYGQHSYNAAYDVNKNGYIGIPDARPVLASVRPNTKPAPLRLVLNLAAGEQVRGHHPSNSGGVTRATNVTIVGHTTPNSLVFTDNALQDYKFNGNAIAVDPSGYFVVKLTLNSKVTTFYNNDLLVLDPFGHQLIRDFTILKLPT